MIIKSIGLTNFRNYVSENFELSPGTNVIFGDNAQGKTNFLEAAYYMTCGKSFRGVRDREMILTGADSAEILAAVQTETHDYTLKASFFAKGRRKLEINGVPARKAAELSGRLRAVLFSPDDLYLIKDGAVARRRFMDMAFSQLRPKYAQAISTYRRLQEHKTRILRDWREKPSLLETLTTFNIQMAEIGAVIIGYRRLFLDKIFKYAYEIHNEISGGREELTLKYKTLSTIDDPGKKIPELCSDILRHMESHREAELAGGSALSGPHKDDIEIFIDGNPAKVYASQGQTRTAALSLKLAERELFYSDTGEYPVLLLDDVLSELDNRRRDFVLNRIKSGQVFITLCDDRELAGYKGRNFEITKGIILR